VIRINHLDKYFNKGKQNEIHVINDVSLELPDKGMVAIFGKSGCGKTTLLNVIGGLDSFASGSVMVENQDIGNDPDLIRNKYMGYVFQNYNLDVSKSCFDNIADALRLCGVADRHVIERRTKAALRNVGMEKYEKRTPDTLSGGQQQRIAIARAIVKNPKIILADEPTGNLDEANTVMIMDLLRTIANDHLVILVTHEANLVDYYCDKVIELADGKIVNVKNNDLVGGFSSKDKNTIYLGELEKKADYNENTEIEYFGDAPTQPIKIRIVNKDGKLYVSFDSDKIHVLDENAEVKLVDGTFEEKKVSEKTFENVDMTDLPPISGTRFGNLFTLKSSIISSYKFNFKQFKKSKKLLRNSLAMLAAVLVVMMSLFGTSISDIIDARAMYNHNVFYVYTPDATVSNKLISAINDEDSGIDSVRLTAYYPYGDDRISFTAGFFETFQMGYYAEGFTSNCVFLEASLAEGLKTVEGRNKDISNEEIVITTAVANKLLKTSPFEYIKEYEDLIGLVTSGMSFDGKNARICGVVESDETSVYLSDLMLAKYVINSMGINVMPDTDIGLDIDDGKSVLLINYADGNVKYPSVNSKVTIHGVTLNVESVCRAQQDYSKWLSEQGIKKMSDEEYFADVLKKEYPNLKPGPEQIEKMSEILNQRYCEWLEYYYSDRAEFYKQQLLVTQGMDFWLAAEKGVEHNALYNCNMVDLCYAMQYKALNGKYPTYEQLGASYEKLTDTVEKELLQNYEKYNDEFNMSQITYFDVVYVVDESDYITMSTQVGETDPSANSYYAYEYYSKNVVYDGYYYGYSDVKYSVIHSSDVRKTKALLAEQFKDLETPDPENMHALLTPDTIFDDLIKISTAEIVSNLVSMAVITGLLVLCMYFIMRSSFMNRIKEIGINRAIGVSKKNLAFKFMVEAATLTTLTVLVGYVLSSAFIIACLGISPLISSIFFYPWWYALILLGILYLVSIVCGLLPIWGILRKTPSEILAKYDI